MLIIDRYPAKGHRGRNEARKILATPSMFHWMPGLPSGSWVLLTLLQLGLESLGASWSF